MGLHIIWHYYQTSIPAPKDNWNHQLKKYYWQLFPENQFRGLGPPSKRYFIARSICHRQSNSPRGIPLQLENLIGTTVVESKKIKFMRSWFRENIIFFKHLFWSSLHVNTTLKIFSEMSSWNYLWTGSKNFYIILINFIIHFK